MNNKSVHFLTKSAVIAALYAVLTLVAAMMNLAYGGIQFRFSEALTILPLFTPAAIPGLTIGCFIANIASPFGIIDWFFGSLATLIAACTTRALREFKIKGIPFLSLLSPVVFNAVIIGLEIACISADGLFSFANLSLAGFLAMALSVGIGELVICFGLGIPLYIAITKSKIQSMLK